MRRLKTAALLTTLLSFAVPAMASQTALVTLKLDPDHFLLGLDTLFVISVKNTGTEIVQLNGSVRWHIVGPDGKEFIPREPTGESILPPDQFTYAPRNDSRLALAPAATNTFYLRTGYVQKSTMTVDEDRISPQFLTDRRFDALGTYTLSAELLTRDPTLSFTSNRATMKIEQPMGIDATVHSIIVSALP